MPAVSDRHAVREGGDGRVSAVVRDVVRPGRTQGARRHRVDDVARAPLAHVRHHGHRRAHGAEHVGLQHPLPVARLDAVERALEQHAGHVDEDVDPAHRRDGIADEGADRRVAAHVCGKRVRGVRGAHLEDLLHGPLHPLGVEVGDDDAGALPRHRLGDGPAHAAGAPDDHRDLAGQGAACATGSSATAGILVVATGRSALAAARRPARAQRRCRNAIRGAIA